MGVHPAILGFLALSVLQLGRIRLRLVDLQTTCHIAMHRCDNYYLGYCIPVVRWPGQAGGSGGVGVNGWGIWHILCVKERFFINSRGLKPEQGAEPLGPLTLTIAV